MNNTDRSEKLVELNDRLAEVILEVITSDDVTAQDLNVARQFLKDRNIDDILRAYEDPEKDSPILKLASELKQDMNEFDRQQEAATG